MKTGYYIAREKQVVPNTYNPLPVVLTRGEGVWLWDVDGKKYLDMMTAYSAVSFGHSNPELVKVFTHQAQTLALTSRAYHTDKLAPFIEKACQMAGLEMAIPMNTGVEAVETAVKCVRRWGYQVKKVPENQAEIIVAENNFHGRTTTVISFSTEPEYQKDFGPFTPGFKSIPFGDSGALEKSITPNTVAFLVEPIQGEGGIIVPPKGYLKEVKKICEKHNVLLVVDEIQCGLGRTGKMFAFQHEDIQPDGLILGKALGAGMYPVSLFLSTREVLSLMTPGSHGSTFGGNPLASAIGYASLSLLEKERLDKRSAEMGVYMLDKLKAIRSPYIKEVRGMGLWAGVDLHPELVSARDVCEVFLSKGVLSKDTHETVVRFAPALTIQKDEIDFAISMFKESLEEAPNKG